MAWYLNKYECEDCDVAWDDEWSCGCDDQCPNCGHDFSPYDSNNLSAYKEVDADGDYQIYYSPPEAGDGPDYVWLASTSNKNLAIILEKIAFDLAAPE